MKHNHAILFAILLIFALCLSPSIAQDEPSPLLDLLANPPEDGILIVELEIPGPMYGLYYILVNVSTGEYYELQDVIPWCVDGMPSGYKGKLLVRASCEGIEKYYLIEVGQVKELLLPDDAGVYIDGEVQWTPDGKLSFVGQSTYDEGWDTDIFLWDGVMVQAITQNDVNDYGLKWSSDGRLVFKSGDKDSNTAVFVWDGITTRKIWQPGDAATWSSDGKLAFASECEIYVWNGTEVINVSNQPQCDRSPTWSSDGKLAFPSYENGNPNLYIWDGQQAINIFQQPPVGYVYLYPVWGPDSQLAFIAYKDHKSQIYIWKNGVLTRPIPQNVASYITWNRDGRLVFVVDNYAVFSVYTWDGHNISLITTYSAGGIFEDLMWMDLP